MFEDLKNNLIQEKKVVADMRSIAIGFANDSENRNFYAKSLKALAEQLDLLNNTIPELLKEWSPLVEDKPKYEVRKFKKLDFEPKKNIGSSLKNKISKPIKSKIPKFTKKKVVKLPERKVVGISYISPSTKEKRLVTINKKDRNEFLKKLKLSEDSMKEIKKLNENTLGNVIRKPNAYIIFSSKHFGRFSDRVSREFSEVAKDLKSANIPILLSSYLSMAIMSSVIAFGAGILLFIIMMIISLSNWIYIVAPIGFVGLTIAGFYLYPASEASSVQKNISYELPFATIHMAAIAGSNITPVKIFKIVAASPEYPNIGAEMKKVIVQIEVYGYDIVTSLKDVAKRSANKKLSELFSGLATNISSGGTLKNYLEKKSQSFLVDYRIERQKYSALAGTFMDVYISILIAAPLVLMMMFIVMNVAGMGMGGLSIMSLMSLAIGAIIIVNIIFIVILNMKQPRV